MKLRIASDLHLEALAPSFSASKSILPIMPDEKNQVLILAGDVCQARSLPIGFYDELGDRFKHIFEVMGNHNFYGSEYYSAISMTEAKLKHIKNYKLLDDELFILDDASPSDRVLFRGGTLWTDYDKGNPESMREVERCLYDYRAIKHNGVPITPKVIYEMHKLSLKCIHALKDSSNNGLKKVIITHHAPSFKSVDKKFHGSPVNAGFYSDLEYIMLEDTYKHGLGGGRPYEVPKDIKLWVHGHMHNCSDYHINKTRVLCNPLGYGFGKENPDWNPELVVEV